MIQIKLNDLARQRKAFQGSIERAVSGVIDSNVFIGGREVEEFEVAFSSLFSSGFHAISCGSGSDALVLAMDALGIGRGDFVIVPDLTWIATIEAVIRLGATPIIAPIDPYMFVLDLSAVEPELLAKAKACIVVHLYGQPADMNEVFEYSKQYGFKIIEDCAQAHLARHGDKMVGEFGAVGCFSFFPGKTIGCYGDGGAVVVSDQMLGRQIRILAHHGQSSKNEHVCFGYNSRLDAIQASVLKVKISKCWDELDRRVETAGFYSEALAEVSGVTTPVVREGCVHSWHQYTLRVEKGRDELMRYLFKAGIESGVKYPARLSQFEFVRANALLAKECLSSSQALITESILSIPCHAYLSGAEKELIVEKIEAWAKSYDGCTKD